MRDLEAKYHGDVLTCMKALQMDRLAEGAAGVERSTKKRKWLAAQDTDPEKSEESTRAVKNRESPLGPFCLFNDWFSSNLCRNPSQNVFFDWLPLSHQIPTFEDPGDRKTCLIDQYR